MFHVILKRGETEKYLFQHPSDTAGFSSSLLKQQERFRTHISEFSTEDFSDAFFIQKLLFRHNPDFIHLGIFAAFNVATSSTN